MRGIPGVREGITELESGIEEKEGISEELQETMKDVVKLEVGVKQVVSVS